MKLFLAVPFSSRVDKAGAVTAEYRASMEKLLAELKNSKHTVYCALEYTGWTIRPHILPEVEFKHDLEEIDAADKIIFLLEATLSAGVQLEMGYAYAKGKQLEIYQIGTPAWSNQAFSGAIGCNLTPVETIEDFVAKVIANNAPRPR